MLAGSVGAPGSCWFLQPQERSRTAAEMLWCGDHNSFSLFCSYDKNAPPKSAKKPPNWSWPPASLHTSEVFQPRPVRRITSCFHSDRLRSVFCVFLCFFFFMSFSSCMSATFRGAHPAPRPHPFPSSRALPCGVNGPWASCSAPLLAPLLVVCGSAAFG